MMSTTTGDVDDHEASSCGTLNKKESPDVNLLSPEQNLLYGTIRMENLNISQTENPLMNYVVLNTLFKYVKSKDLKKCRLVCKKWCIITLPLVREKCTIKLCDCGSRRFRSKRTGRNVTSFVKLIESNKLGIPFVQFYSGICGEMKEYGNVFLQLLDVLGNDVQKLSFCSINPESMAEILGMVPNLKTLTIPYRTTENLSTGMVYKLFPEQADCKSKLPYLTSLQIMENGYGVPISSLCPTFFEELFGVAENISNIWFRHFGVNDNSGVISVLRVIEFLGRESCIQSLTFPGLTNAHVEILTRMIKKTNGLRLKKLKIWRRYYDALWDEYNYADWFPLINLLKNELVELTTAPCNFLGPGPDFDNDEIEVKLPRMAKLKVLELILPTKIPTIIRLVNGNFKNTFPVLENLSLSNEIMNLDELFIGNESCPRMKSLHLGRDTTLGLETFNRIIYICPALKSIQLEITQDGVEIMKRIWTQMIQLEELDLKIVVEGISIDSLLTGIPDEQCQTIEHYEKDWHSFNHFSKIDRNSKIMALVDNLRVGVSIANLKNLRRFRLSLTRHNYISNIAGYLGLYSLKCLRHIHLDHCQMSRDFCKLMTIDMELETWRFQCSLTVDLDMCWVEQRDIIPKKKNHEPIMLNCLLNYD